MANALVVFTPRSGSTIVSDLLAYKYNALNLDEMLTTSIRSVLYDKMPEDIKTALSERSLLEAVPEPTNQKEKQSYIYNVLEQFNRRVEFVKETSQRHSVVVKYYPTVPVPGVNLIEWAIENNFELYFVSRRSFNKQLYSYLLAEAKTDFYKRAKKAGKLDIPDLAGYLNTRSGLNVSFPPKNFPIEYAVECIVKLTAINNLWRLYLNAYGNYGKLIYYEDTIVKGDFSQLNISNELLQAYGNEKLSLRPTHKYNVGEQITNWEDITKMIKHYEIPNLHE